MSEAETREVLAEYAHDAWSGWMKYLFSKGEYRWVESPIESHGKVERVWIMPAWAVERWARQMNTPYADLPEEEKKSDREEADRMLAIVKNDA
jgi:hypothetical protein